MSPRRRLVPGEKPLYPAASPRRPRRWGLPLVAAVSVSVAAGALVQCAWTLHIHETQRHTAIRSAAALSYVRSFMADFTSPDPFHANDYTDHISAQATGEFAEQYRQNRNAILIEVARAEPTTGTVLDVGVSRWNTDGTVEVLVTTKFTAKSPDGKLQVQRDSRWVVTAKQEGERWKISKLTPMV
ncbi:mammalian cell entry protein [Mycobacterium paragordonae]|uniref:mammalian cell entry protein n=1 Tax=Mycobacterium paragordonae TaxID=1389713 RepID=UPI0012E122A4|nr:mammalian cell entry protein [Mycobacterium paragordonae]